MAITAFDDAGAALNAQYAPTVAGAASPPDRTAAPSPFRVDEGYSEDPRNPADSDTERDADMKDSFDSSFQSQSRVASARQWLLSQPVEIRTALTQDLIHSLPTSVIADIVRDANYRLHFDPVECLPHEIIGPIFECLDPKSLVNAALTSKAWKARAYDSRLWRRLFGHEGWSCQREKVELLESAAKRSKRPASATDSTALVGAAASHHLFKKRYRLSKTGAGLSRGALQPHEDGSLDLPDMFLDIGLPTAASGVDQEMSDAPEILANASSILGRVPPFSKFIGWDATYEQPTVDWQYIYSQRRRLEGNWYAGRFSNFRLPHPEHPEEAHTQCVYTIQFSENHLVSGSRDKTVRVWDLDSQRLRLPPLEGHTGSVLCLQFDERPEQDVIISGGSDADVIVWRFSDGEMLNRMAVAHSESVLNLRFDERYLVTCSKDKTIRVWNRRHLSPTDPDYPDKSNGRNATYPQHIVDIQDLSSLVGAQLPVPLPPFSLLMTFDGHGAAVNALQVHGHEIVSASGDRKVMLWNIKTGEMTRVFSGHTKGIACIQYDGRRIVSGSSDNTVRIFDASTSAVIATLDGHRNLVRTVQAEFGDMATSSEVLEAEARRHDRRVLDARARRASAVMRDASGSPKDDDSDDSADAADAMSVSEEDVEGDGRSKPFVLGAKLPPGGGGTRWSKIVSGSYDETLIIWRRDKHGRWYIAKELRQEEALRNASRAAGRNMRTRRLSQDAMPAAVPQPPPRPDTRVTSAGAAANAMSAEQAARTHAWHLQNLLQQQRQARAAAGGAVAGAAAAAAAAATQSSAAAGGSAGPAAAERRPSVGQQSGIAANDGQAATTLPPHAAATAAMALPHHHHVHRPLPPGTNFAAQNPLQHRAHHHHHHHHAMAGAQAGVPSLNNRVFKLQFDARRIVCCSQDPVIVGWDFAAGEQDLADASWAFGTPS